MQVLKYIIEIVLGIALPLAIQRWDRQSFDEDQRARAWNFASWAAALYAFGPLSMLGWFWVTRRSPWYLKLTYGVLSVIGLLVVLVLLDYVVCLLLGLRADAPWKVLLA